jgi:hypothetical protein
MVKHRPSRPRLCASKSFLVQVFTNPFAEQDSLCEDTPEARHSHGYRVTLTLPPTLNVEVLQRYALSNTVLCRRWRLDRQRWMVWITMLNECDWFSEAAECDWFMGEINVCAGGPRYERLAFRNGLSWVLLDALVS